MVFFSFCESISEGQHNKSLFLWLCSLVVLHVPLHCCQSTAVCSQHCAEGFAWGWQQDTVVLWSWPVHPQPWCRECSCSAAKADLAADHCNCPVLQCNQRSVGLFSQASPALPLLCKILGLYILCIVASSWKKMEFWDLEWNLNSHDSSFPHIHPVFCNWASTSLKTLASTEMFVVMNINRLLQACLKTCKAVRSRAARAAKEEPGTRHAGCHLCPHQPTLLHGAWSLWTVSDAWQQVSLVDLGLQMGKIPCDQSPLQGWTNHNQYLWVCAFGSPQVAWFRWLGCLHLEPLE